MDEEVPNTTGLVDIDLDQVSRFSATELASSPSVFSDKGLLNNKIRLGEDTELRTEGLFSLGEQMQ